MNYKFLREIQINEYFIDEVNKKPHTFYRIEIKTNSTKYFVDRRFKEIEHLHNELKKKVHSSHNFVEFPTKHLYTRSHKTFEQRRVSLDSYINKLVSFYDNDYPIELVKFLKLDELSASEAIQAQKNDLINEQRESMNRLPLIGVKEATLNNVIYSYTNSKSDVVLRGVLAAFYS